MIKKILPILAILFFAFGILYISITRTSKSRLIFAADKLTIQASPTPTATIAPIPKVQYYLVYPGMLPDAPLYKLKMIRDKIWVWLTTNVIKKAELYLLYSDKRIGAGKVLIEGNKVSLGLDTILKGEKYLEMAIIETEKAKQQEENISLLTGNLRKATLKHEEVLGELKDKVNGDGKVEIDNLIKFVKNLQERVTKL